MCQFLTLLLPVLFATGGVMCAEEAKPSLENLIADLKKGEKDQLRAIDALAALGPKGAEAASALVDALATKNEDVRLNAAMALGRIGAGAVAPLTKAAASPNADVRFYAVWSLAFVGPPAKGATPVVLEALKDKAADVRRKAAYALSRIDPDPAEVVAGLVKALGDEDADVRLTASEALPKLGAIATPPLIEALQGDNVALRRLAAVTLGKIGPGAKEAVGELEKMLPHVKEGDAQPAAEALAKIGAPALPSLVRAANHEDQAVRTLAVTSLFSMSAAAVPAMVDLLGAKHIDVRRQAAALLGSMQVSDKMVVVGLGYATADKDSQVKMHALESLRNMGRAAGLAEPYVSKALMDIDSSVRITAFNTLQALGVNPVPALKKALASDDPKIRITTASLMAGVGVEVALAEPILLEGLKHEDRALKMQCALVLSRRGLQADVVLPIFLDGLKSDIPSIRREAAQAMAPYGVKARAAVPALIGALEDADDGVSAMALQTLRQVGAEPKVLFPAMVKVLRRKEANLHAAAAQVLFQYGPGALPEVIDLLKTEKSPGVRLACLQTLAMVGPPAQEAVGALTECLNDTSPRVRMTAARALGNIGPAARAAEDALAKAEQDSDDNVQKIARAALAQVRGKAAGKDFQIEGVITPGDPLDKVRGGCFSVVHTYEMKEGQTYTLNLNSSYDNFLRLENPQGQMLAQDDDSGGALNARIIFRAPADGWYRIIVTTFSGGASGPYRLTVK